jgi:hypothetical protein
MDALRFAELKAQTQGKDPPRPHHPREVQHLSLCRLKGKGRRSDRVEGMMAMGAVSACAGLWGRRSPDQGGYGGRMRRKAKPRRSWKCRFATAAAWQREALPVAQATLELGLAVLPRKSIIPSALRLHALKTVERSHRMSNEKRKDERESAHNSYLEIINLMRDGGIAELESVSRTIGNFPLGKDSIFGRYWITSAIHSGSLETIGWMIQKGVNLRFHDDEGYTPIHSCIEHDRDDKHEVLYLLLKSGADVNAHGINDWTPLHLAAICNDQKSMQMLLEAGADRTIRTRIDDYATPEEEARNLGHEDSADFLLAYGVQSSNQQ